MKHLTHNQQFVIILLTFFFVASSGPLKTVPWYGHKGAVSFTFDDGCASQITNVIPALKNRGIHATFFLYGTWYNDKQSPWFKAVHDGNEIANHSATHADFTKLNNNSLMSEIVNQAKAYRNADSIIECVTIAYPGCARNDASDAVAKTEHIIGRSCSFGNFSGANFNWTKQPDNWMNMGAAYIDNQSAYNSAMNEIDRAVQNNTWFVTLNHGVGGDWISIGTDSVNAMFDKAIKNKLWIDTYQKIAAYWRASFTIDTVRAISNGSEWNLAWKSPHPRMPKSVPILITLDKSFFGSTVQVYQMGKQILPLADDSYPIDFMNMQLTVNKGTSISKSHIFSDIAKAFTIETTSRGLFLNIQGFNEGAAVTIYDFKGASVYRNIHSKDKTLIPQLNKGVYIIKIRQGNAQLNDKFVIR